MKTLITTLELIKLIIQIIFIPVQLTLSFIVVLGLALKLIVFGSKVMRKTAILLLSVSISSCSLNKKVTCDKGHVHIVKYKYSLTR